LDAIIAKLRRGFSDLSAFTHPEAYRRDYQNTVALALVGGCLTPV
jgi:hypothetical protein